MFTLRFQRWINILSDMNLVAEKSSSDLSKSLNMDQSNVSRYLTQLKEAGFIRRQRYGYVLTKPTSMIQVSEIAQAFYLKYPTTVHMGLAGTIKELLTASLETVQYYNRKDGRCTGQL